MKLQFKRSGGFSPITNVAGEVDFKDDSAEVSSPDGNYRRALDENERARLQDLARVQLDLKNTPSAPGKVRDAFQYDITLTTGDGKPHKLASPAAPLLNWVKEESDKILQHKMEQP